MLLVLIYIFYFIFYNCNVINYSHFDIILYIKICMILYYIAVYYIIQYFNIYQIYY